MVLLAQRAEAAVLRVPAAYATVQKAINAAQPGDTVLVGSGTYNETVTTARKGTAEQPIILDGQGVATVTRVNLKHAHIHLQNFTITGSVPSFGNMLAMGRGAHFCVISNNLIDVAYQPKVMGVRWTGPTGKPFDDDAASDTLFISNTVCRAYGYIIMSIYGDRNVIHGNVLRDSPQGDFFNLWGRSNVISANLCSNLPYADGLGNHPDFIQSFGNNGYGSYGHIIESNHVTKIEGGQLMQLAANLLPSIRDWTFRNNVFEDIALQGSCTTPGIKFYNNTFIRCNYKNGGHVLTFGKRAFDGAGVYDGSSGVDHAHGAEVLNNVFLDCGDARNTVGWYSFGDTLTNVIADYNFVAKNNYTEVQAGAYAVGVYTNGVAAWNNFRFYEPHGINGGNPQFVNELASDYRLQATSPLIGAGTNLNFLFGIDVQGALRGSRWDTGAFQFQPGATDRPGAEVPRPSAPGGLRLVLYP